MGPHVKSQSNILENYKVRISGIKTKPELNDQIVTLTHQKSRPGRYSCKLKDGSTKSFPYSSLELINPDQNQTIERRENPAPHGAGIFAKRFISKGALIFKGEYPKDLSLETLRKEWRCSINHSCSPNCISTTKKNDESEYFFAMRDIHPGEEITRAYVASCIWSDKATRLEYLKIKSDFQAEACFCHACVTNEAEEDKLRKDTFNLAEIAFGIVSKRNEVAFEKSWKSVIKPLLMLEDTNPVKTGLGFCFFRGFWFELSQMMKEVKEKEFALADDCFNDLAKEAHDMVLRQLIMLGFVNNSMITDKLVSWWPERFLIDDVSEKVNQQI